MNTCIKIKDVLDNNDEVYELREVLSIKDDIIPRLKKWTQKSEECRDLFKIWRWSSPNEFIYVLFDKNENIVGLNAFNVNVRFPYVNCYYFELDEKFRGLGLGKELFFSCVALAKESGKTRLTLRTHGDNEKGLGFYRHIGLIDRYYDSVKDEIVYDLSIEQVNKIEDFKRFGVKLNDEPFTNRAKLYENYIKVY